MEFRKSALEAYEMAKAEIEAFERKRKAERAELAAKRVWRRFAEKAEPDYENGCAVVEGLRFRAVEMDNDLKMERACSKCGKPVWVVVESFSDVGAYLSGDRKATCVKCARGDLDFERSLIDALADIADILGEIRDALAIFWK